MAGDMQGGVPASLDSSVSGSPDPLFTMPNTSDSLVAEMEQMRKRRRDRQKESTHNGKMNTSIGFLGAC